MSGFASVAVDESVAEISNARAVAIGVGVGVLIVGWTVYDSMMQSPVGRSEKLAAGLGFALFALPSWGLTRWLSGRPSTWASTSTARAW